jgi:hypothetical protein
VFIETAARASASTTFDSTVMDVMYFWQSPFIMHHSTFSAEKTIAKVRVGDHHFFHPFAIILTRADVKKSPKLTDHKGCP